MLPHGKAGAVKARRCCVWLNGCKRTAIIPPNDRLTPVPLFVFRASRSLQRCVSTLLVSCCIYLVFYRMMVKQTHSKPRLIGSLCPAAVEFMSGLLQTIDVRSDLVLPWRKSKCSLAFFFKGIFFFYSSTLNDNKQNIKIWSTKHTHTQKKRFWEN